MYVWWCEHRCQEFWVGVLSVSGATQPWISLLVSLSLSFLFCKMAQWNYANVKRAVSSKIFHFWYLKWKYEDLRKGMLQQDATWGKKMPFVERFQTSEGIGGEGLRSSYSKHSHCCQAACSHWRNIGLNALCFPSPLGDIDRILKLAGPQFLHL